MTFKDISKRLPALTAYVCSIILVITIYREFSYAVPKMKVIGSLYAPILGIAFLTAAFIFALIKEKKLLFRFLCFAAMFVCNVFCYGGIEAQVVLIIALVLDLALEHIDISRFTNLAVFIIAFIICGAMASLTVPAIEKIKTPKMITDLQESWFSIIEDEGEPEPSHEPVTDPQDAVEVDLGRLLGNVITNEAFDPSDPTMSMGITSSYPLEKMMVFACYDYDPVETKFDLAVAMPFSEDSADKYFGKIYTEHTVPAPLPYWIEIEDNSIYKDMRFIPYCDFRTEDLLLVCKDSYVFLGEEGHPQKYTYYIDPDSYYETSAPGYGEYVTNNYIRIPGEFRETLTNFLLSHGIEIYPEDRYEAVSKLCEVFDKEYIYNDIPPELPQGEDPVLWFLNVSKTGYSKHFAAAQVLLLRAAGIPARYTYGYKMKTEAGQPAIITEGDAYAFCQVYIDGRWQIATELKKPAEKEDEEKEPILPIDPVDPEPAPTDPAELPEEKGPKIPWKLIGIIGGAIALAACLTLLWRHLARKFRPKALQIINGDYKALKKFYFIRQDIGDRMLKVRYSKEGPEDDDARLLEREISAAKAQFKYRKKYLTVLRLLIFTKWQKTKSVISNMFQH